MSNAISGHSSRVIRVSPLSPKTLDFLAQPLPIAPSMTWCLRSYEIDTLWLFFDTPSAARQALAIYSKSIPMSPALESELEPLAKLEPFDGSHHVIAREAHQPKSSTHNINSGVVGYRNHSSSSSPPSSSLLPSLDDMPTSTAFEYDYTLSSNPPNPKSSLRSGDWICSSTTCNAHNFGRNLACIGCGTSRTATSSIPVSFAMQSNPMQSHPGLIQLAPPVCSPRFMNTSSSCNSSPLSSPRRNAPRSLSGHHPRSSSANSSQTTSPPLLTPSGRTFSRGGSVRNISDDPLVPCIMYWPDNEPLPERGQLRPTGATGSPHPPILNTGNRGPITHQPGDWICLKCNYLNWRRRKVCQTCFPYAEGNGDSISTAVQAERIALLTNVLQSHVSGLSTGPSAAHPKPSRVISISAATTPSPLASPFASETSSLSSSPPNTASSSPPFSSVFDQRPPRFSTVGHQLQLRSQSLTPPSSYDTSFNLSSGDAAHHVSASGISASGASAGGYGGAGFGHGHHGHGMNVAGPGASTARRAQSHYDLNAQYNGSSRYQSLAASGNTIYQTSHSQHRGASGEAGYRSMSAQSSPTRRRHMLGSPFGSTFAESSAAGPEGVHAPRPLLPSFLQDIVDDPQQEETYGTYKAKSQMPSPLLSLATLSLNEISPPRFSTNGGSNSHSSSRQNSLTSSSSTAESSLPSSPLASQHKLWNELAEEQNASASKLFGSAGLGLGWGSSALGGEPTLAGSGKGWSWDATVTSGAPAIGATRSVGVIGPPRRGGQSSF